MATFPAIKPTYSFTKKSEPRVRTTKFGDGYEQRIRFGLNQNPKEWSLTFEVTPNDANTIESFLDARAYDAASFTWTAPDGVTGQWVCRSWSREYSGPRNNRIDVTFNQVFEPPT